ncbi:MAG: phosphoribosylformylglycinamidine synthase subunit PurL [Candidatus Hydrogenedentes bacterium CG07_land_8_20_14_0_80_42_17]|nr:MAG: phosphoribosylformylglycinamidine synthase subunit PurL [Candidatus Hydrogenedentes bacterium CG07_land_8_20_14_0_80_42_17]
MNVISDEKLTLELGMTAEEIELARKILGREPTWTEYGIFSVMWSEHCSYKSSKPLLAKLPTKGKQVIQGPGENAGVIALDENIAIVFKIESHNHPSMVEPYQGSATGVGGILRDIFTMGARPIALLDSLHFGDPSINDKKKLSKQEKNSLRGTVRGVIAGISDYGNSVGIPTVAGELHFDSRYQKNCLVNVMAVGIGKRNRIANAKAQIPGEQVLYYGNSTGRDGIHGATFASDVFDGKEKDRRPNVQIGDPFMEKRIMEATLELIEEGVVSAIQDMGAAGLTCSSCEMAARGGTGIEINIDKVPLRVKGITPYEIMLSESQERMLAVVKPENIDRAKAILSKWELNATILGEISSNGMMVVKSKKQNEDEEIFAEIPAARISNESPIYSLEGKAPSDLKDRWRLDVESIPVPSNLNQTLFDLISSPELSSRAWVFEQYDHMVGTSTVLKTIGSSSTVMTVDGSSKGIAVTTDSCAKAGFLDPRRGAIEAVAEAARNIACSGARPVAITNNLNFGNPREPEIFWQMKESVEGISTACIAFDTPVTGGNVSLYNESVNFKGERIPILPTVVIGMVGIIDRPERAIGIAARGSSVVLLGDANPTLDASEYLFRIHNRLAGRPQMPDLLLESRLQRFMVEMIEKEIILGANDVSQGGLAVAAAEMSIAGGIGMKLNLPFSNRKDIALFGEAPGLILATCEEKSLEALLNKASSSGVPARKIGELEGFVLSFDKTISIKLAELKNAWSNTLYQLFDVRSK